MIDKLITIFLILLTGVLLGIFFLLIKVAFL